MYPKLGHVQILKKIYILKWFLKSTGETVWKVLLKCEKSVFAFGANIPAGWKYDIADGFTVGLLVCT